LLASVKDNLQNIEKEDPELATAFRKLEESPDNEDMLDDERKMKILEFLRKGKA